MATSRKSKKATTGQSTFLLEEHPAKTTRSRDLERVWLERVATSPSRLVTLLSESAPAGWFGRTSPEFCPATRDETLQQFWDSLPEESSVSRKLVGEILESFPDTDPLTDSPTEFLTLNTSEWTAIPTPYPNGGVVSSLSDILVIGEVPLRYYLSSLACSGILRRAEKRGKDLPQQLAHALKAVAD